MSDDDSQDEVRDSEQREQEEDVVYGGAVIPQTTSRVLQKILASCLIVGKVVMIYFFLSGTLVFLAFVVSWYASNLTRCFVQSSDSNGAVLGSLTRYS